MTTTDTTEELIRMTIESFVPLKIHQIQEQGGPSDHDYRRLPDLAQYIAEHGDELQFYVKGKTYKAMAALLEALPIMAFQPGGVTFLGMHFEAELGIMPIATNKRLLSEEEKALIKSKREANARALSDGDQMFLTSIEDLAGESDTV